jgi:hypothetical protein
MKNAIKDAIAHCERASERCIRIGAKRRARPARLDADRKAKPMTEIVPLVKPGKRNMGDNIQGYEIRDIDPGKEGNG